MKTKNNVEIIKKGTNILSSKPFAYVLSSKFQGTRCDFCLKSANVMRCSGCRFVHYCGRDCQRQGWTEHSSECAGFKKVTPRVVPDAARLMGKIIMKLRHGGDQEKGQITATRHRKFKDLMSHYSDLKQDKLRMEHFQSLVSVLASYLGKDKLPNTAEMMGIYGRICVNGFNILDPETLSLGTGIYLGATILDHSCTPNAVAVFEGVTINIRTIEDMPAPLDWNKVRISYIDLLNSTAERRLELQTRYYFLCDCPRCQDPEGERRTARTMACPADTCNGAIPVPHKGLEGQEGGLCCPECGHQVKASQIFAYQEESQLSNQEIEKMRDIHYLDVSRCCLRRHGNMFHQLDLTHAKMLDAAFESAISLQQWEEAEEYGRDVLPAYLHYHGPLNPLVGLLHLKLAKLQNLLGKANECRHNLTEADKVLSVTHGRQSTLYKEHLLPLLQQY